MLVKRQRMHYMSSVDMCVCVISAFELALSHMWQSNSFCLFNTINNLPLSFWTVCDVFILLKAKPQYCWGVCVFMCLPLTSTSHFSLQTNRKANYFVGCVIYVLFCDFWPTFLMDDHFRVRGLTLKCVCRDSTWCCGSVAIIKIMWIKRIFNGGGWGGHLIII